MDEREAREILDREIAALRRQPYEELRARIPRVRRRILFVQLMEGSGSETHEVTGASGVVYQVESQVFWDGTPEDDIRVMVAIDDGGLSAVKPITDDFIVAPDGSFVGE